MNLLLIHLKKYWQLCLLVLLLASVNQVFSLIDPIIFRHVIDDYAAKFNVYTAEEFFKGVSFLLLLAVGAAFVSRLAKNFQDYFLNTVTQKVGADIYNLGVRHSLDLPYQVFEDQRSGETLGILQKVRSDVEKFLTSFINIVFVSLIGLVFVIIYALSIYWLIALVFIFIIPLIGSVSYYLSKKIKSIQKDIVSETTALAGSTTESLRNIELVKSLGLVDQEINRLNNTTGKILSLELKKLGYLRSISFIQGTLINFLRTVLLLFLLYLVFNQTITFGQFFSLYIYSFFIFSPLQDLGGVINNYRDAEISLSKFKDILNIPVEDKPIEALEVGSIKEIEFKNVYFGYSKDTKPALTDINFKVQSGQTIAFVGPSGSGKTSLVKLLVGLYKPSSGFVCYNNTSTNELDFSLLRKQFGLVTQETQLFAGSIRDNLTFVNPEASDEECFNVLEQSSVRSLIERGDKGLDTVIGEGGVKVSGGERQRLSIARALLRKPNVLIFDEATSALDSLTEESISKTIRDITKDLKKIVIIIAHRLSTVMHADMIYVLEKGKIVEQGNHEDLLKQEGLYAAMWRQQVGEI